MNKFFSYIGLAVVFALIAAGLFYPLQNVSSLQAGQTVNLQEDDDKDDARIISVMGSYEVSAQPEKVEVYLSIVSEALKAKDSQTQNADLSSKVINALVAAGIARSSIETVNYSLQEKNEWSEFARKYERKGYETTNQLKITSANTNDAGKIIDSAIASGANRIDSIAFSLTDAKVKQLKLEALKKASEETKQKADAMAGAVGVKVKQLESLSEQQTYYYPVYQNYKAFDAVAGAAPESAPTEILAGQIKVSAQVTAEYEIE